ncbi:MAG: S41 family peptidase, partial [Paracoccus sp. (in: a-proteobacteria)]
MYKKLVFIGLFSISNLSAKDSPIPTEEIKNFVDVYNAIRQEYVEETTPSELIDNAIEGMLSGLDPHSVYLKKNDAETFYRDTNGKYPGIGIEVEMVKGLLKVIAPLAGSPADKAGIRANDTIIKINDKLVDGLQMNEVINLLRGNEGEAVEFVIQHDSGDT